LKRKIVVLDTGFFEIYFSRFNKQGENLMSDIIQQKVEAYTTYLNITEFYYINKRIEDEESTLTKINAIFNSKIKVIPINKKLAIRAGELKAKYKDILSIVDAYVIALAEMKRGEIITTDNGIKRVYKDIILIEK